MWKVTEHMILRRSTVLISNFCHWKTKRQLSWNQCFYLRLTSLLFKASRSEFHFRVVWQWNKGHCVMWPSTKSSLLLQHAQYRGRLRKQVLASHIISYASVYVCYFVVFTCTVSRPPHRRIQLLVQANITQPITTTKRGRQWDVYGREIHSQRFKSGSLHCSDFNAASEANQWPPRLYDLPVTKPPLLWNQLWNSFVGHAHLSVTEPPFYPNHLNLMSLYFISLFSIY